MDSSTPVQIDSNPPQALLNAVFHMLPDGAYYWVGSRTQALSTTPDKLDAAQGCYFNTVSFRPAEGGLRRRKQDAVACHALVLDDVGSKVKPNALRPSYRIETSEGNEQWGYIFAETVALDEAQAFMDQVKALDPPIGDAGALRPVHLVRLPYGINGKERNGVVDQFEVRLVELTERRFTLDELAAAWGIDRSKAVVKPWKTSDGATGETMGAHPLYQWLTSEDAMYRTGEAVETVGEEGNKLFIQCPHDKFHTTASGDKDAVIIFDVGGGAGFHCLHEHAHLGPGGFTHERFMELVPLEIVEAIRRHREPDAKDIFKPIIGAPAPVVASAPAPSAPTIKPKAWGDLTEENFPPILWVIAGLLPPGVSLLAGKPKQGKSWLVHAFCLLVAAGRPVFGLTTRKSVVMYLALEDSDRRLQERTRKLMRSHGVTDADIRDTFLCATEAARLGEGLEDQLRELIQSTPDLRLIVIDVLARIRPVRKGNQSVYESDYEVGRRLKAVAAEFPEVAILVVHHAKKGGEDGLDAISGTHGLSGGMDNAFTLFPSHTGDLELHIMGRDIEDSSPIPLTKGADGMWTLEDRAAATEKSYSETRAAVLAVLREGPQSPKELAAATGINANAISQLLRRMKKQGLVTQQGYGRYQIPFDPLEAEKSFPPSTA